jgi:hypothetical protein
MIMKRGDPVSFGTLIKWLLALPDHTISFSLHVMAPATFMNLESFVDLCICSPCYIFIGKLFHGLLSLLIRDLLFVSDQYFS